MKFSLNTETTKFSLNKETMKFSLNTETTKFSLNTETTKFSLNKRCKMKNWESSEYLAVKKNSIQVNNRES